MLRQVHKLNLHSKSAVNFCPCLHYSKKARVREPKEDPVLVNRGRALKSFDELYKKIYGDKWPSMRVALLAPSKKALLVNNFSDLGRIMNKLEDQGILSVYNSFENRLKEYSTANVEVNTDLTEFESPSKEERKKLQEEGDKYFKEKSEQILKSKDESVIDHISKKMHEDPTVNIPLEETLSLAEFDTSRIIEPQTTGTALSAALQEFVPSAEIMGKNPDWVLNTEQFVDYERSSSVLVDVEFEDELHFPPNLHVYSYERSNIEDYDGPTLDRMKIIDYEEIELRSLLPVLALGIEPKDKVLDMCTQSTDYGLMMLQSLYPESVMMNIHSDVRLSQIHRAMQFNFKNSDCIKYTVSKRLPRLVCGDFNKILLCVPNLDDRNCLHSAHTYFNPMLGKERLLLPDEQTEHVIEAIKLVKPGGTVLYSTATLSPLQNEGVIRSAIGKLRYEHGIEVKVKDLTRALQPLDCFFKFAPREIVGLGHLAVPFLPLNCGPCYVCKLIKVPNENDADDVKRLDG